MTKFIQTKLKTKSQHLFTFGFVLVMLFGSYRLTAQVDPVQAHFSDKNVKLFDRNFYDLSAFEQLKQTPVGMEALKMIDPEFLDHPDLGISVHPVRKEAIELVDERTATSSTYLLPDGTTIFSSASQPINYIDENGWYREIRYTLEEKPVLNDIYRAGNQPIPKSINAASGKTTFETAIGNIAINQQSKLKFTVGQSEISAHALQTSQRVIGQNGLFVTNAFPQIDMQVILMKNGAVKTNYIVKDKSAIDPTSEYVVIEDYITLPQGMVFDFDPQHGINNGNGDDWEGNLIIRNDVGEDVFHYMSPMIYDKAYASSMMHTVMPSFSEATSSVEDPGIESDAFTYGAYRVEQISPTKYKISVVVKTEWLLAPERVFPVVIDPVTFTGNQLNLGSAHCARRVSGTTPSDNPGPTGVGCFSTTTVLPAGYMLSANQPVRVFSGYATRGCAASSTWMKYYGPCGMYPRESGFFYFCNTILGNVDCGAPAGGHAMDGILSRCMLSAGEDCAAATAPSCANQTITFNVCYQTRCFSQAAGTCAQTSAVNGTSYVEGLGFFRVDVLAEKITHTLTGGGTVCPSSVNNLSLTARFGVPNALNTSNCNDNMGGTYSWSATISGGGSLSATSGTTNTSGVAAFTATMPAAAATVTITTTVCNTSCAAPAATMCDVKSVVYNVGNSIPPVVADMTVCNGVNAVPTITNPQGGYTYTWENGIDGAGAVIGTGTSRTIAAVNNTSVDYSVRATAPCISNWMNFTITWGPVQPPSTTDAAACPGESATLTANCGASCRWYTVAAGGASFNSTGSYTINPVASTVTYYVEYNAGAGCVSARTPVTLSTNALTVTPTPAVINPICSGTTAGFSAAVSGHSTNASMTVATAGPNTIEDFSLCTGPDCTAANSGMLTLATPNGVANPLVASSIQEVCFTTSTNICGKESRFYLISPAGTVLTLFSGRNKASDEQTAGTQICFTPTAAAVIYAPTMGAGVDIPAGDYIPDGGALDAAFVGEAAAAGSTWALHIVDNALLGCGASNATVSDFTMVFGVTGAPTCSWTGGPAGGSLSSTTSFTPTYTSPGTVYNSNYTVTVTDVTGCTGTATVNVVCPTLLPIELVSFYGDVGENEAGSRAHFLKWKTQSETDFNYFDVERSANGLEYEDIGRVQSQGQSSSLQSYNLTDEKPFQGSNFYRLKIVDLNGQYEYSDVITIDGETEVDMYLIPNPTSKALEVVYHSKMKSDCTIEILDAKGSLVTRLKSDCIKGQNSVPLDVESYDKGIYTVLINVNGEILTSKFIKL